MKVTISVEPRRKCGYRKVGGLYLMGDGPAEICERLPMPLTVCPVCGEGIKPARAWTWIKPGRLFAPDIKPTCKDYVGHNHGLCPMCNPGGPFPTRAGLLWIGDKFYSPQELIREALDFQEMGLPGISRRIPFIPRDLVIGEHWVFLAHRKAVLVFGEKDGDPGVFRVFKPTHIDYIVEDENNIPERAKRLVEKYGDKVRLVKVVPAPEPKQLELEAGAENVED